MQLALLLEEHCGGRLWPVEEYLDVWDLGLYAKDGETIIMVRGVCIVKNHLHPLALLLWRQLNLDHLLRPEGLELHVRTLSFHFPMTL